MRSETDSGMVRSSRPICASQIFSVAGKCGDALSISTIGNAANKSFVPVERKQLSAILGIPYFDLARFSRIPVADSNRLAAAAYDLSAVLFTATIRSRSAADFWYDRAQAEWGIIWKGAARKQLKDGRVEMNPVDFITILAFQKHRVDWTTPDESTVWLDVRYGGQTA